MVDIGMNSVSKILGITQTPIDIKAKVIEVYYNHQPQRLVIFIGKIRYNQGRGGFGGQKLDLSERTKNSLNLFFKVLRQCIAQYTVGHLERVAKARQIINQGKI